MFAKPYNLKSNNALKNSEKKHLVQRVQDEFPFATEEKIKELLPPKGTCSCMKLVLHSGDIVSVYVVDGAPLLVESPQGLVPTVCALWKVPDLVPMLTIHSPVLAKVQNGAPLYLPGVSLPPQGEGFPLFQCGTVLGARTEDNAAACLVGRAAMSSADMLLRASGVCLDILHVYGDTLCKDHKFGKMERPKLAAPKSAGLPVKLSSNFEQISLQKEKEEWPSLGPKPVAVPRVDNAPAVIPVETPEPVECEQNSDLNLSESSPPEVEVPTDMDALLRWCLLSFIKLESKTVELPLKTNLLYKNHMLPYCPSDRALDVKKSSYKKLSKFLEAMQQEGLVETREVERGVSALVALHPAHPAPRAHVPAPRVAPRAAAPADPAAEYTPPLVREMYCVTAAVVELFAPLKKGTALTAAQVRSALTEYVKRKELSQPRGTVSLDPLLATIMNKPQQEVVRWESLQSGVVGRMTPATEMRFADGTVSLAKSKLQPVRMDVAVRSGNKKVTLVSNLESFGFRLGALAALCQRATAASCGVTRSPAARADQLMLQGDQTHFVAKLLIEKYQLPKKFVEGADKALNKKK